MFNLGDRIKHIETGSIGIVIGFGKRIVKNKCLPTVKVKITSPQPSKKTTLKDLQTQWTPCSENHRAINPKLESRKLIAPIARYNRPKIA